MAGYRLPGTTCGEQQPWSLLDGTLPLWLVPAPGPICVASRLFRAGAPLLSDNSSDVGFLFRSCLNPARGIDAYAAAATALGVDVATIQAVADVETSGEAFDGFGRPRILFERHYFHRLTAGRFDLAHARVSAKAAGGYGKFSAQYGKLEEAYTLDADAALRSASWGRFQIMGDNFIAADYSSAQAFVQAMARSEEAQLQAFVSFVPSRRSMADALRRRDWAGFAKAYNGPGYAKNHYHTKLAAAYARLAAPSAPAPTKPTAPTTNPPSPGMP
ncbi:MAG: N-acetylmuramidase family protein [Pseudomonadota bacterium]|nr:N-acetylmuramidase family protein [Pseudomonadota bacterium]